MSSRRRLLWTATAAAGTLLTSQARAETASSRLNAPGPESRLLAERVGLWDMTETVWPSKEAPPTTSTGLVAERRMIGALLQEFIRPPDDEAHSSVKRTDLLTYERLEGKWGYVSFDTRAPVGLMAASSTGPGDGSTITLFFASFAIPGDGSEPTGQMLRMKQIIRFESKDRDVKEQYFALADGTGQSWLAHQYSYVRRA